VYQKLTTQELLGLDATLDLIWHKQVPLKVSILTWHLLRKFVANEGQFGGAWNYFP